MNIVRLIQRHWLLAGLLGSMILCGNTMGQEGPSELRPIPPDETPAHDPGAQIVAEGLLHQAVEAFKKAPAVTCKTTVKISSGPNQQELVVEGMFGPDKSMKLVAPESLIVVKDGWLNIVVDSVYDRYLRVPVGDSATNTIEVLMGDRFVAGYEIMMREGEPLQTLLDVLTLRSIINPRITGLEEITTEDGRTLSRINLAGRMGAGSIDYDPDRKKIVAARSDMYPLEGAESFNWVMNMKIEVEFLEKLPEPIEFDPGIRTPVSSREKLDPVLRNKVAKGGQVPVLKLPQLDGGVVDLADLRGKIVVLDFWATWCAPCKRGLPKLEALYKEHAGNTGNVLVYAVDVLERVSQPEDRIEVVSAYWKSQKYTVPTLISLDDSTQRAWGITGIPLLVIVAPDGTVAQVFQGYSADLKEKINSVIKSLENG